MPFTPWKQEERNRDRKTYVLGGFAIVVTNNSLDDNKKHSLEPT